MRHTRAKYHRAVKELKRNQEQLRHMRLAESLHDNGRREFWTELKKMSKGNRSVVNQLDGYTSDKNIADHLANKYQQLFSSTPTSHQEYTALQYEIFSRMAVQDNHYSIDFCDVIKAIKCLKHDKNDGSRGTCSNHIIYAPHKFVTIVTSMLNSMITHGHSPEDLLEALLVSIPKDLRGNMLTSDNYRDIALCSALTKVIDYIFIDKHSDVLQTSNLQFAFQQNHSAIMCTAMIKEVVSHYNARGSNVYACLLDASKAFDRLNHGKLFQLLLNRNLPAVVVRFLLDSYTRQIAYTQWNSIKSNAIPMLNGVKQGGVLSPVLFCIYMDELLHRLEKFGAGCYIGNQFYGGFGYADDLKVLCPSISGLQKLISICEKFGNEYDMIFNAKKTLCICYGRTNLQSLRNVCLNGVPIKWQSCVKYLGNMLSYDLCDDADVSAKKCVFISAVNRLNYIVRRVPSNIKVKLLQTYCTAWYGCQTWQLGTTATGSMETQWKISVRRTLGLPPRTRSILLPGLAGSLSFSLQHQNRFSQLLNTMMSSTNSAVQYIAWRSATNTTGALGRNHAYLCIHRNLSGDPALDGHDAEVNARITQIHELLRVRDGLDCICEFTKKDTEEFLGHICTF